MKRKMFLGADNNIFENARLQRAQPTNAERVLWSYLQNRPLGFKFRRQHPAGIYIADFYCHALKMVIEVDGSIHDIAENIKNDIERQKYLESEGIKVIRFKNCEVEKELETVQARIEKFIQSIIPKPT